MENSSEQTNTENTLTSSNRENTAEVTSKLEADTIEHLQSLQNVSDADLFKEFDDIFANILGSLPPKRNE